MLLKSSIFYQLWVVCGFLSCRPPTDSFLSLWRGHMSAVWERPTRYSLPSWRMIREGSLQKIRIFCYNLTHNVKNDQAPGPENLDTHFWSQPYFSTIHVYCKSETLIKSELVRISWPLSQDTKRMASLCINLIQIFSSGLWHWCSLDFSCFAEDMEQYVKSNCSNVNVIVEQIESVALCFCLSCTHDRFHHFPFIFECAFTCLLSSLFCCLLCFM